MTLNTFKNDAFATTADAKGFAGLIVDRVETYGPLATAAPARGAAPQATAA